MNNLLVILGKTSSGKDRTVNELISKYNYKKIITYATRPMRKGEKQDITYQIHHVQDLRYTLHLSQMGKN